MVMHVNTEDAEVLVFGLWNGTEMSLSVF